MFCVCVCEGGGGLESHAMSTHMHASCDRLSLTSATFEHMPQEHRCKSDANRGGSWPCILLRQDARIPSTGTAASTHPAPGACQTSGPVQNAECILGSEWSNTLIAVGCGKTSHAQMQTMCIAIKCLTYRRCGWTASWQGAGLTLGDCDADGVEVCRPGALSSALAGSPEVGGWSGGRAVPARRQ